MSNISQNKSKEIISKYHSVKEKIILAADSVKRDPQDIQLIVVTKTHSFESIKPLLDIGHTNFGENRVQEADSKWALNLCKYPDTKLHLIGHLQSNKVKIALQLFNVIHTIDSHKLLIEIVKHFDNAGNKCHQFFLEINMANEKQKTGIPIEEVTNYRNFLDINNKLSCDGLMCIPPYEEEPSPYFLLLKKIALKHGFSNLSMGMSADFEKAIQFGATHIRVGSEIFGHRQ